MNQQYRFETRQLHIGQSQPDPQSGARAVPIVQTASYVFDNCDHAEGRFNLSQGGNIYGRLTNPTQDTFEARIASLEGGAGALAVASGSAAIAYVIQTLAQGGDHIVCANNVYGGTYNLLHNTLPSFGITTTFVDVSDLSALEGAILPQTKGIFIESLSNPHAQVVDIETVAQIAHRHSIPLVVDNTFATPYLLRPIEYGADIVVHSATKYIGGHGTALGGVLVDSGNFDWTGSGKFPAIVEPNPSYHGISFTQACGNLAFLVKVRAILLRDLGATLSPFHAFLFLQGLETLSLRLERHVENALRVVEFLSAHPRVAKVNHPSISQEASQQRLYAKYFPHGGGAIFTFNVAEGEQAAREVIDKLQLFSLVANVADVKSLVIHPATTTHSQLTPQELAAQGITGATVRLSIGTEHIDDIIADLTQALA